MSLSTQKSACADKVYAPFIREQHNARDNQRQEVIDDAVSNQRTENQGLVMVAGDNVQEQALKNTQAARNLAENAQNLRNDEDADEDIKRNVHKRNEREIQHQRGHKDVCTADDDLSQSHFERRNVKLNFLDDNRLFVKQRSAEINEQTDGGDDGYGYGGEVRNRAFTKSVVGG